MSQRIEEISRLRCFSIRPEALEAPPSSPPCPASMITVLYLLCVPVGVEDARELELSKHPKKQHAEMISAPDNIKNKKSLITYADFTE
jgi:hypothetical protein